RPFATPYQSVRLERFAPSFALRAAFVLAPSLRRTRAYGSLGAPGALALRAKAGANLACTSAARLLQLRAAYVLGRARSQSKIRCKSGLHKRRASRAAVSCEQRLDC